MKEIQMSRVTAENKRDSVTFCVFQEGRSLKKKLRRNKSSGISNWTCVFAFALPTLNQNHCPDSRHNAKSNFLSRAQLDGTHPSPGVRKGGEVKHKSAS